MGPDPAGRGHFRVRTRTLAVGAACAALATCAKHAIVEKSDRALADLLGHSISGQVDPSDVIWEPSRGFWVDTFLGRRIVFLGRGKRDTARAVYRASVTVTRAGRPLDVRGVVPLSSTDLAEATGLVADGEYAAFGALAAGRTQSVTLLHLDARDVETTRKSRFFRVFDAAVRGGVGAPVEERRVSFTRPPADARYELQGKELVLSLDPDDGAVLDAGGALAVGEGDTTGAFTARATTLHPAGDLALVWSSLRATFTRAPDPKAPAEAPSTGATWEGDHKEGMSPIYAFPPAADLRPVEGRNGVARVERSSGSATVTVTAFDTRFLAPRLAVGATVPATRTGHVARGGIPWADRGVSVAAIALPAAPASGAWDRGSLVAPLDSNLLTLDTSAGVLSVERTAAQGPRGDSVVQWPAPDDGQRRERSLACATAAGHWIDAWSASATPDEMRSAVSDLDCAAILPARRGAALGGAWLSIDGAGNLTAERWAEGASARWDDVNGGMPGPLLYFVRIATTPEMPPALGTSWSVSPAPAPEPASLPAVYEASLERLGSTVRLRFFMPHRFDWAMRAGEQEKSHRLGGVFEKALPPADQERAFFAFGLGVGKRHAPAGLRIAGSTGHVFHSEGGVVEATSDGLRLTLADGEEPEGDATELPLTVEGRALTSEARVRGPRQLRADLCVLPDGAVVVAEEEVDNHEGPASVLVDLGCALAVALDRGADRPAWSEDRTSPALAEPHATSSLYALGRPFGGSVRAIGSR